MTNTNHDMGTFIQGIDHAARQDDRWLFLAVLVMLLFFAWLVIRWLVKRTEAQNRSLEQIAKNQNETSQKLAVVIAQNSEALNECAAEIKYSRESRLAILLLLLPFLICGCLRVPATRVSFNPRTHELSVRSPKDVELTNLVAVVKTNGEASITIGRYSSKNNAEVIGAVAAQNAATLKAVAELGGQAIGAAASNLK